MSRRRIFVSALLLISFAASSAEARRYGSRSGYGGGGGGTVYSSAANGLGNLIRAEGAYNQMTAQAWVAQEQAYSLQLANRLKAAQTYYQLRRLNEAEHAEQERKLAAARGEPQPVKIRRLTSSQLDPVTGAITWPAVLRAPEFDAQRLALDRLFEDRAIDPTKVTDTQVEHYVDILHEKLDAQHDQLTTSDFFTARYFLEAMASESRTIVPAK